MDNSKKKMKVLITASTFPRYLEDTEPRFIFDLAKELMRYCDVTVLVPSDGHAPKRERMEGVKVIRYRYFPIKRFETLCYPGAIVPRIKEKKSRALLVPFLFLGLWLNVRKYEKRFDIVNAHWIIPQGIVQGFCKSKYMITGHGADVTSMNKGIVKMLKKRALKKASIVTAVSNDLSAVITKKYGISDIPIQPMGCNVSAFSPKNRVEGYFGQGDKKVILFVGRLAEKKGVTYLIDAMKNVDAVLYIAGKGPLEAELKAQAKELSDKVHFMGAKTHEELPAIYASADVFVAPSITASDGDKEGFGLVILEALASGVPVIASRSGGIVDLIKHEDNGLLVPEKDSCAIAESINKVLASDDYAKRLVENGMKTAAGYDYRVVAKNYYEMYKRVYKDAGEEK